VIHADLLTPQVRRAIPEGVAVIVVPTPPEILAAYGIEPEAGRLPEGASDWNTWIEGFEPLESDPAQAGSTIIYTSGTTGRPKGVRRPPSTPDLSS